MSLKWPAWADRTPEGQRSRTSKFKVGFRRTQRELRKEMERLGVDEWWMDDVTGSGGDPGIVVRWQKGDDEYAIACDAYTAKSDNLREIYLWINETRMRGDRAVKTGADDFAAAALPPGDEDRAMVVGRQPAHDILGVAPDAPEPVVRGAFRELAKVHHGDTGSDPDSSKLDRIRRARDQMLGKEAQ